MEFLTRYVAVSAAGAGDNEILPALLNHRHRVIAGVLVSAGAVAAAFTDGPAGTALTGPLPLAAQTVVPFGYNPAGHFQTAINTALTLNLGGAVGVRGWLTVESIRES